MDEAAEAVALIREHHARWRAAQGGTSRARLLEGGRAQRS